MLSLTLLLFLMYFFQFSIVIISLGEERADLYASRVFACLSCMRCVFVFSSSFWCLLAVDCNCDSP